MPRIVAKGAVLFSCVVFFMVALVAVPGAVSKTADPVQGSELHFMQKRLSENLKKEALLLEKINVALSIASRPHAEYLLYQKGLGLEGYQEDLERLRFERRAIFEKMEMEGFTGRTGFQSNAESPISGFQTYSGSPSHSFNEAGTLVSGDFMKVAPLRIGFFRFLMTIVLAAIFSLPLIALYKRGKVRREKSRFVRIFPMFTVYSPNGSRILLSMEMDGQEKGITDLRALHAYPG